MNCFITGGAGFIGSHLCRALLQRGDSVCAMDDLSTGSMENILPFLENRRFRFIQDNIVTSENLERKIGNADCIFHLAAAVGVELVVHEPVRTILTNVDGSERVLTIAAKYGKRCILASTSEVYGKSQKTQFTETDDLVIGPSTHSRWSYACSKLLDEFLLTSLCRDDRLNGTIVRFFNTVGPGQTGKYGMVLPRFVSAALKGEPLRVFGSGEQTRCFCHVEDTVRALLLLMNRTDISGEIFNIGSTESVSVMGLAKRIVHYTNSKSEIIQIPYDQAYSKGFEDMMHRAPNCEKIFTLCGWRAEHSLKSIIEDVAESMRRTGC